MKIVATGATSFVGSGAVKALLERGHKVYAVLRKGSSKADRLLINGAMPENLVILEEDLGSLERLAEQIPEPCDVFLHMGWKGAGSDSRSAAAIQKENAKDSLNAVQAAKALGCRRFVFTGSQAEYGVHDALMNEETGCRPTSPTGRRSLRCGLRRRPSAESCPWTTATPEFSAPTESAITPGPFSPPV